MELNCPSALFVGNEVHVSRTFTVSQQQVMPSCPNGSTCFETLKGYAGTHQI